MEKRQRQLEQGFFDHSGMPKQGFWQIYIQNGARVMRHDGSVGSARKIVDNILTCSEPIYIQIQDEVHDGKNLSETAAGRTIKTELENEAERSKAEFNNLKVEMETAAKKAEEDKDRLTQKHEKDISSLEQRMATESEDQRRRTREEVDSMKTQMEGALKSEREQQERLTKQFQEERLFLQQKMRAESDEQKKMLQSINQRLLDESNERARGGGGGLCSIC